MNHDKAQHGEYDLCLARDCVLVALNTDRLVCFRSSANKVLLLHLPSERNSVEHLFLLLH